MAGIVRATQVVFGSGGLVGTNGFGAAAAGNIATQLASSTSLSTVQTGTGGAWAGGWLGATLGASKFPTVEDMNAKDYVLSTQIAYILERGMPEYDAGTTYNTGDICKGVGTSVVYKSIADANTGQSLANASYWLVCGDLANLSSGTVPQPVEQTVTGANHSFVSGDNGLFTKRSNSGSAMADTLPGTSGALANGWFGFVENVDATAALVFGVGAGGSISQGINTVTSFILLPGETGYIFSQGTGNYNMGRLFSSVLHASPTKSSFKNLKVVWASNTTATITADELVLEDSNGNTRRLSTFSQGINSASSGAGGLDTGSIANSTWYYLYAIFNPGTVTAKALMSLSATAPTLPSGYTFASGPIGAVITDGSAHFLGFIQSGRNWQYQPGNNLSALPTLYTGAQGTIGSVWAAAAIGGLIPTTIAATGKFILEGTSGSSSQAIIAPNNSYPTNGCGVDTIQGTTVPDATLAEFILESTNVYIQSLVNTQGFCLGFTLNI